MEKETLEKSVEMNENIAWELAKKRFEEIAGYAPDINNRTHELMVASLQEGILAGAKWQAEQEYAEHLSDEAKKWDAVMAELEAYREHKQSEYAKEKVKFKQDLNDAMHEAHQIGREMNTEQSAFVKTDNVDGEWLSPVATERAWQEEQLVNIFGHYPNASPRWQYMNGLIQNSLQAERMYSEEEVMDMFHELSMHLPLHYEFLVREMFKKK